MTLPHSQNCMPSLEPLISFRIVCLVVVALLAGLVPLTAVRAQGPGGHVDGVVYDSLRKKPLAAAVVQLIEVPPGRAAYSATADSLGAFHFDSVRAGQFIAGILDPLLDTLGVQAPYGSITVSDGSRTRVALAIPPAARLAGAICAPRQTIPPAAAAPDSTGTLVGHVYDALTRAPVESAIIAVLWPVLTLDARGMRRETRQLHAKSNADGWFAICGLGVGDYQIRAESGARNTGYIDFDLEARQLARVSLVLGADADSASAADSAAHTGRATITGTVTAAGRPVEGAQVVVDGSARSATTDSRGAFTLSGIPDGTRMAEARALGYAPARVMIEPSRAEQRTVSIVMSKRVNTLDAVTVYGTKGQRVNDLNGFAQRQRTGFGKFLTPQQIEQAGALSVCDLLRHIIGLRVEDTNISGCTATLRNAMVGMGGRTPRACEPTVYLDGMKLSESVGDLARMVSPHEIMGIEVYSSSTEPPQFPGACGSLIVWTKS
jgi:hypothetical protein